MRPPTAYRLALAAITLVVVAVATCWAVLTPAFRAPDELQHVNSVIRLAYGGGWPAPGEALMSPAIQTAREQSAVDTDIPGRHWNRANVSQFTDAEPVPDEDRVEVSRTNALPAGGIPSLDTVDQMTQHPPLYYALGAGWLHLTGTADSGWDDVLLSLRLFDVLLLLPVPLLAAATVRTLLRDRPHARPAALVAAAGVLFFPMSAHILAAVTNDALVTLAGAVLTWLAARVVAGDLRWRTALGIGLALGVGLLTKVMAAFAVPMVVAAYVVGGNVRWAWKRAWWPPLARVLLAGAVAFAVGGWWWLRNLLVLGAVQPVGIPERWEPVPNAGFGHFATTVLTAFTRSFFGDFGWLELRVAPVVFWGGAAIVAVVCLVALVRRDTRWRAAVLLLLPVGLWGGVVVNAWDYYVDTGWITAIQGRYLFAGLTALVAVMAIGLRPRARVATLFVIVGGIAAAAALGFAFHGMYWGYGDGVADAAARLAGWSPLSAGQLVTVGVLTVCAGTLAVVACVRFAIAETTVQAVPAVASTATTAMTTDGTGASV